MVLSPVLIEFILSMYKARGLTFLQQQYPLAGTVLMSSVGLSCCFLLVRMAVFKTFWLKLPRRLMRCTYGAEQFFGRRSLCWTKFDRQNLANANLLLILCCTKACVSTTPSLALAFPLRKNEVRQESVWRNLCWAHGGAELGPLLR